MAYKQDIQIRSCLFKLYLQVWLASRASVAHEPCKCRTNELQVLFESLACTIRAKVSPPPTRQTDLYTNPI